MRLRTAPLLGAALAAALASTTGYCVLRTGPADEAAPGPALYAPTRLLPSAIIPFAPEKLESFNE